MQNGAIADAVSAATSGVAESTGAAAAAAVSGASAAPAADTVSAASSTPAVHAGLAFVLDKLSYTVMVPMVYFAILFFLVAVIVRITALARGPAPAYPLATYPAARFPRLAALRDAFGMPQVRAHKPVFWAFLVLFHVALIALVLGHFDMIPALRMLPAGSRHMIGAGGVGVAITVCLFYFIFRRFRTPVREISVPADYLLLLLLLFTVLLGDLISWGNSWTAHGFVMTKADFALYLGGLAGFTFADPRAVLHGSHYHFIVLHVLLANLFFITLPFSKVMHAFFSIPVNALRRVAWTAK